MNNSKIDNIIYQTEYIDRPIDCKIQDLSRDNKIKVVVVFPTLVDQGGVLYSTITNPNIENLTNQYSEYR